MPQQNDVIHVCDGLSNITKKCYPLLWQQRVISKERQHRFVCGMLDRFQEIERWEEEEWEMKLRAAPVQISGRWFSAIIGQPPPTPTPPAARRFKNSRLSPLLRHFVRLGVKTEGWIQLLVWLPQLQSLHLEVMWPIFPDTISQNVQQPCLQVLGVNVWGRKCRFGV